MIEVHNLTKSYQTHMGRHYVLRNVNAVFPSGVNIGLLGANGAGKTTFLRILGGIDYPDKGSVKSDHTFSWPLGLSGSFVRHLTGRENCRFVCQIYGRHGAELHKTLDFVKDLSGLEEYFDEPVRALSSGMRGRLNFALSMAFDFDYFLIDELTATGDRRFRAITAEALDKKRETSKIIMASHSMNTLRDFCDVGVLIRNGDIKVFEDLDSAVEAYENE